MPYITKDRRAALTEVNPDYAETAGELNFEFTNSIREYIDHHGLSYKAINDVLGALEGAKLEFYRRVAVPYEEGKMRVNGDVYDVAG